MSDQRQEQRAESWKEKARRLRDRLAKLEDGIRALAEKIESDSDRHQQQWRNGASPHYEGRADQAADDADRLRALLDGE